MTFRLPNGAVVASKPADASAQGPSRRDFLKSGAAVATLTLAPGVTLMAFGGSGAEARVDAGKRWGILIDAGKLADGGDYAVTACQQENGWKPGTDRERDAQWIRKVTLTDNDSGREIALPVMCQHCEHPPCVDVCPTGASFKRADGIVLVDKHICIGCRYCMMACPFKARSFIHEPLNNQKVNAPRGIGTVESCTLCVDRVDAGKVPACVEASQNKGDGAFVFGDLNDPNSEISKRLAEYPSVELRADLQLNAGVRYVEF